MCGVWIYKNRCSVYIYTMHFLLKLHIVSTGDTTKVQGKRMGVSPTHGLMASCSLSLTFPSGDTVGFTLCIDGVDIYIHVFLIYGI